MSAMQERDDIERERERERERENKAICQENMTNIQQKHQGG